jgi:hypothetical protein
MYVHFVGEGQAIIAASQQGNANYDAAQPVRKTVTVTSGSASTPSVTLPQTLSLVQGETYMLTPAVSGISGQYSISWQSDNQNVAAVAETTSGQGSVTAGTQNGTATITVYVIVANSVVVSATCTVTVTSGSGSNIVYTVTFDSNGHTSGTVPAAITQASAGAAITLPGNTGNLVKTGSIFGGWTEESSTGTVLAAGSSYTPTANITLYVAWNNTEAKILNILRIGTNRYRSGVKVAVFQRDTSVTAADLNSDFTSMQGLVAWASTTDQTVVWSGPGFNYYTLTANLQNPGTAGGAWSGYGSYDLYFVLFESSSTVYKVSDPVVFSSSSIGYAYGDTGDVIALGN